MAFCSANPKFGVVTPAFHRLPVFRRFVTLSHSYERSPRGYMCRDVRIAGSSKRNADICKELKEFILAVGLPPDQVSSTKEISQQGRVRHLTNSDLTNASSVEQMNLKVSGTHSQLQIDRLKVMLHHKEMELLELKQKIENEKIALSILQTKARKEIGNAIRILLEKNEFLNSFEEKLSELKEVHIAYHGDGSIVEVAGSFNGWVHPIRMEPSTTSRTISSSGSRSSTSWSATVWLYPGVYEIKFIVDDIWKIDPQQEHVIHGSIENNVIRVDT